MLLPLGLSMVQAAAMAAAVLIAAFVRGYSGFGFSALVVAFAGVVADPRGFVPVVILCELSMTLIQARGLRGHIDWRRVWAMLLGAALAMPLSVTVLARVGVEPARLAISAFILVICAVLLSGWAWRGRIGDAGHFGVGVLSGMANGAAVGGLPVAAFLAAQPVAAQVFRATMVVYLTAIDIVALPLMARAGMVSHDTLLVVACALPLALVGVALAGGISLPPRRRGSGGWRSGCCACSRRSGC